MNPQLDSIGLNQQIPKRRFQEEHGMAVLLALIGLSVFSLLALYMCLDATLEVRISDNHESRVQADFAALSGINHAREVLRGLDFNDLLKGPDGTYSNTPEYLSAARTFAFRNPLPWTLARGLDILNPATALGGVPDDGLLNTGKYGITNGLSIVPQAGIALTAANPYGSGLITTSRYFVKVADNNGEARELALDPADNPFVDGDAVILIRSLGVSRTIEEFAADSVRRNSACVYEARFRRAKTFALDAPVVLEGNVILPSAPNMFDGNAFRMEGGENHFGIGTIDPNLAGGVNPRDQVIGYMAASQYNNVRGMGLMPSVGDITGIVSSDPDKALLMDPNYLWNFIRTTMPEYADSVFEGNQTWSGSSAPYLGSYDITKPPNDPSQDPKVTFVNGDVSTSGNLEGAGILVITGKFYGSGTFDYDGLVLVIGQGDVNFDGLSGRIYGGMFVAQVQNPPTGPEFGTPKFSIRGQSNFTINSAAIEMALRLLPAIQIGIREITSALDP